jgi:hypothetical protein
MKSYVAFSLLLVQVFERVELWGLENFTGLALVANFNHETIVSNILKGVVKSGL